MDVETKIFLPPRPRGLLFNLGMIVVLGLLVSALLMLAANSPLGPTFLLFLLAALGVAVPIPFLIFRGYSLWTGKYQIDRNGLHLKWGVREEEIPLGEIEYVEYAEDLLFPLELPRLRWPGAITGRRHQDKLGVVEFMAAEPRRMLMIGTPGHVFVISPKEPAEFIRTYREAVELGSLTPYEPASSYPQFLLADIWRIPGTRILLIITLILSLALFVLVGWSVPTVSEASLGFNPQLEPLPPVSPGQLFLLPSVNILFVIASYLLSLVFFREQRKPAVVYMLWVGNVLTALLFLAAVLFII
jgi:hypothetical protein